ncbi:MAG TPA: proline dehydrogenase family protein [Gaiellaceae bacterium]
MQRFSSRYIAGATLDDAVSCVRSLNAEGKLATVDVLGEEITHADEARAIAREYLDVFDAVERDRLDANVSVKLTALGLQLSYDLCKENLLRVLDLGRFVRIDMEDSSTTDDTLRLYRELRESGRENVGIVLQACLRRTLDDVRALGDLKPSVRLCKGIYVEPPSLAYSDAGSIRSSFVQCLDALLESGATVAAATHDEALIREALARDVPEFQMLLGVREERASELVAAGRRVRIYVPFGEQWYAYSLRRLQENPAMAATIARAAIGRALRL